MLGSAGQTPRTMPRGSSGRQDVSDTQSNERFRTLYQTIGCGVLVQGPTGEVLDANEAAERLLGMSFDTMRGRTSATLWPAVGEDGVPLPAADRPTALALHTRRPVRDYTLGLQHRMAAIPGSR